MNVFEEGSTNHAQERSMPRIPQSKKLLDKHVYKRKYYDFIPDSEHIHGRNSSMVLGRRNERC